MALKDTVAGFFSRKESRSAPVIRSSVGGSAVWTPTDYQRLAKEGYSKNVVAYFCVNLVANAAAGIPWELFRARRGTRKDLEQLEEHPILTLLERPNPLQSGPKLIRDLVAFNRIAGNFYLEGVGPTENAPPRELYALRPDRVKVIPGSTLGTVGGYQYGTGKHAPVFSPLEVLHGAEFSATNDWYGMAPLEAAARSIDQMNAAQELTVSLLQNRAIPTGILKWKNYQTEEERSQNKTAFEEAHAGIRNAGRTLFLEGEVDFQQIGLPPEALELTAGANLMARWICLALGVPPQLAGIPDAAKYSNMQVARAALWTDTILPIMDALEADLNAWLVPRFGDDLVLRFDRDSIEALKEDRDSVWKRAEIGRRNGFLTANDARDLVGIERSEDPAADLLSAASMEPSMDVEPEIPSVEDEAEEKSLGKWDASSDEEKAAYWKSVDDSRERYVGAAAKVLEKRLSEEAERIADAVDGSSADLAEVAERALRGGRRQWEEQVKAIALATADHFGRRTYRELTGEKSERKEWEDAFDAELQRFLETHAAAAVQAIEETTRRRVASAILEGKDKGLGAAEIAGLIRRNLVGDKEGREAISRSRALLIARTEVLTASAAAQEAGALAAFPAEELAKEWIATPGGLYDRAEHQALNGKRIHFSEKFDVGGSTMAYPGDPAADIGQRANCRCAVAYVRSRTRR